MSNAAGCSPVEAILQSWLDDPDVMLFCGSWRDGGIMELLPHGTATLSDSRYEAPFNGVRELRILGSSHHVHLDMARMTHAWYVVAPSICYGYRPSFELRLTAAGRDPGEACGLGLALERPYHGRKLRAEVAFRYFRRVLEHTAAYPLNVSFRCERTPAHDAAHDDWRKIELMLDEFDQTTVHSTALLRNSLQQRASALSEI